MVDRRAAGLPLEIVLGWVEFCGLRIAVDPGVFVPRRRTEFLAYQAATLLQPGAVVVDLCCGSGAVGAALVQLRGPETRPGYRGLSRCTRITPGLSSLAEPRRSQAARRDGGYEVVHDKNFCTSSLNLAKTRCR